jgi:hypothetical protein
VGPVSVPARNAGLQALVRKETHHIIWPHCMLRRQILPSRNISEELQAVFEAVVRVVNFVRNSLLRRLRKVM